jgi:hypothetical protein
MTPQELRKQLHQKMQQKCAVGALHEVSVWLNDQGVLALYENEDAVWWGLLLQDGQFECSPWFSRALLKEVILQNVTGLAQFSHATILPIEE